MSFIARFSATLLGILIGQILIYFIYIKKWKHLIKAYINQQVYEENKKNFAAYKKFWEDEKKAFFIRKLEDYYEKNFPIWDNFFKDQKNPVVDKRFEVDFKPEDQVQHKDN